MAQLRVQPAHALGAIIQRALRQRKWNEFHAAVAWVRRAGLRHLLPDLDAFLRRGGRVSLAVGISFQQTSEEALSDLLSLQSVGSCGTWIHHNEAGPTFHPKLYVIRDGAGASVVIAGSSNLTAGGLFTNVEASVLSKSDVGLERATMREIRKLQSDQKLSRRLDASLLRDLVRQGYVTKEASVPHIAPSGGRRSGKGGTRRKRLFGSVSIRPPSAPKAKGRRSKSSTKARKGKAIAGQSKGPYKRLWMRVRTSRGGTQVQIPFDIATAGFLSAGMQVTSSRDGRSHAISLAKAHGKPNTLKLDIPEAAAFVDPVVEFRRGKRGVRYTAYDGAAAGGRGRQIHGRLQSGIASGRTSKTRGPVATSTWWRLYKS